MKISKATQAHIWPIRGQYHVLTFAEEGFAPLNIHTRGTDLTKPELVAFSDAVNERKEVGSLHPRAPVSAVPRAAIRSSHDPQLLQGYLEEFFRANAILLHATKIICDFRGPSVPAFVHTAIRSAASCAAAESVEDIVIVI